MNFHCIEIKGLRAFYNNWVLITDTIPITSIGTIPKTIYIKNKHFQDVEISPNVYVNIL